MFVITDRFPTPAKTKRIKAGGQIREELGGVGLQEWFDQSYVNPNLHTISFTKLVARWRLHLLPVDAGPVDGPDRRIDTVRKPVIFHSSFAVR
jgi:hypothetical protein